MGLQPITPRRRRLDGSDTVFQHDIMDSLLELETCQPTPVQLRPRWPVIVMPMAQQEAGQLLTRLAQGAHRRLTRTHQVAHRLMRLIRHPDRGQFTGAVQLGKLGRIPPVSLDPLARLPRNQRWGNHNTLVTGRGKLSVDAVAAGAGFLAEAQSLLPAASFSVS